MIYQLIPDAVSEREMPAPNVSVDDLGIIIIQTMASAPYLWFRPGGISAMIFKLPDHLRVVGFTGPGPRLSDGVAWTKPFLDDALGERATDPVQSLCVVRTGQTTQLHGHMVLIDALGETRFGSVSALPQGILPHFKEGLPTNPGAANVYRAYGFHLWGKAWAPNHLQEAG